MRTHWRRLILWGILALAVVAGLFYAFRPQPVLVDLQDVGRGPLLVTVDDEGETRVEDVFVISTPLTGRVLRIESDVGDPVVANKTLVAEVEPADPEFLDVRSEARAEAELRAAEAARTLATAEVKRAEAELSYAASELDRARTLIRKDWISKAKLEDAERLYETRQAEVETARAALEMREHELEVAHALLLSPSEAREAHDGCDCIPIHSPVDGVVLRVLHENEGVVSAGDPLLEVGDPNSLEVVVDLLSEDAVKVRPGQRVILDDWGGATPLEGKVRRVEPYGFTKVSALGIEEQRVNVIVDFVDPSEYRGRLGHGFRVEARIVLWENDDVLQVPQAALFRDHGNWSVYVDDNGRALLREVTVGHSNGLKAEVVDGLSEGERIVLYPSNRIEPGVRIAERP
jgi:HlyD family secretion protein